MPIPPFDGILGVLPPHLGDPTKLKDLSPYACTTAELCYRFASSPERLTILHGLLDLRAELGRRGIRGFQWIDGSFVEDAEVTRGMPPKDIDVVTFVREPLDLATASVALKTPDDLTDNRAVKLKYHVDHFVVTLSSNPEVIVDLTRYWALLFSHRRFDGVWKGMLRLELPSAYEHAVWLSLGWPTP